MKCEAGIFGRRQQTTKQPEVILRAVVLNEREGGALDLPVIHTRSGQLLTNDLHNRCNSHVNDRKTGLPRHLGYLYLGSGSESVVTVARHFITRNPRHGFETSREELWLFIRVRAIPCIRIRARIRGGCIRFRFMVVPLFVRAPAASSSAANSPETLIPYCRVDSSFSSRRKESAPQIAESDKHLVKRFLILTLDSVTRNERSRIATALENRASPDKMNFHASDNPR